MEALTIRQPHVWCITNLRVDPKRIENRSWIAPSKLKGKRFAIHAGKKKMTRHEADDIWELTGVRLAHENLVYGAIVATAVLVDVVHPSTIEPFKRDIFESKWYIMGHYAWVLDDVKRLKKPVPCDGQQRLWTVPADILAEMVRQSKW